MKKPIAKAIRIERLVWGPADPWLLGAFLVLFGVAVAAALPPITASIRNAAADSAKRTADGAAEQRATVRVRLHFVRVAQASVAGGHDFVPESTVVIPVRVSDARLLPRRIDLAAIAQERGFSARAPPIA